MGGHGRLAQQPGMSRVSCVSSGSDRTEGGQWWMDSKFLLFSLFVFNSQDFLDFRRKFYGSYNDCYVVSGLCWQQCLCTLAMVNVLY